MDYQKLYAEHGVSLAVQSSGEGLGLCPFHQDSKPSLSVNLDNGLWRCFACNASGNFDQFMERIEGLTTAKTIPESVVEGLHTALLASPKVLEWLQKIRGVSLETVKAYRLGLDGSRVCIPIKEMGEYVNIRKHSMEPVKSGKTISYGVGYGAIRLWPMSNLAASDIWICEGELDCLVLNQLGLSAVTSTGGAQNWKPAWDGLFVGKKVVIVYDIDRAGGDGAANVYSHLSKIAASVKVVTLPVKKGKDVTDYVVGEGGTKESLLALAARIVQPTTEPPKKSDVLPSDLVSASHQEMVGRKVSFKAVAAGKDLAPFTVPKKLEWSCLGGQKCGSCNLHQNGNALKVEIDDLDPGVLKLIGVTDDQQKAHLKRMSGIPVTCYRPELKVKSYMNWEEAKGYPDLEATRSGSSEYVVRSFYVAGNGLRVNQSYEFEGMVTPNPQNQYVTFLCNKYKALKNDLDTYVPSKEALERLKIFQTNDVMAKLEDIANDLTHNVTHIYQRNDIIHAYDMVAHSVLGFTFQDKVVDRGWVEGLVVGDTRCGKSETAKSLMRHYRMGELVTGENVSYAGLVGGMQQTQKRWSIIWGKLPMNDGRMIVLDEVSGMRREDIALMSGIRSSGLAEITKIQTERTSARVRILWMSNSRSGQKLDSFANCAMIVEGLIGKKEDISRFDFCQMVGSDDVPVDVINASKREKYEQKYTSELCQELLLWSWSRRPANVRFTQRATESCLAFAKSFGDTYTSELPLVERNEQRLKFARMGAAIAARVFSTEDGVNLTVDSCHVEAAAALLDRWYSSPNFNYKFFSETRLKEIAISDDDAKVIRGAIAPYGFAFARKLLGMETLKVSDFEDLMGGSRELAKSLVHTLIMAGAIKRKYDSYVLTPGFIRMLRKAVPEDYDDVRKVEEF